MSWRGKRRDKATEDIILDDDMPFAIQEAYRTLRTNIMFSLPGEKCKRIVVTSSSRGEGKSTTAINLGIALADNRSKVLLIDCDLRLPTIAIKAKIPAKPGLTNLLYEKCDFRNVVYHLSSGLDVIPAGAIPPNPSETLGSVQMRKLIDVLSDYYEYIILDTPPICTVTDAALMAKISSGIVLAVRQGIADYENINEAINLLKMADVNILGFVFIGVDSVRKRYKDHGYGYVK